mmetsp:Transcript_15217/g.40137  ORF Transcript_15217/g.40137 Transcript_15217/m.40137 type:complete len:302 (+) Transcript_15217:854-1759(+)
MKSSAPSCMPNCLRVCFSSSVLISSGKGASGLRKEIFWLMALTLHSFSHKVRSAARVVVRGSFFLVEPILAPGVVATQVRVTSIMELAMLLLVVVLAAVLSTAPWRCASCGRRGCSLATAATLLLSGRPSISLRAFCMYLISASVRSRALTPEPFSIFNRPTLPMISNRPPVFDCPNKGFPVRRSSCSAGSLFNSSTSAQLERLHAAANSVVKLGKYGAGSWLPSRGGAGRLMLGIGLLEILRACRAGRLDRRHTSCQSANWLSSRLSTFRHWKPDTPLQPTTPLSSAASCCCCRCGCWCC